MKKIIQYIPLHLSFFLVIGVSIGYYNQLKFSILVIVLLLNLLLLGIAYVYSRHHPKVRLFFQILSYSAFFILGIIRISSQSSINQKSHYSHFIHNNNKLVFQIEKELKPTLYHEKYYARILRIDSIPSEGKVLLNLVKDSIVTKLQVGEVFFTQSSFSEIYSPKNPYAFDYKNYIKKKGIEHQLVINHRNLYKLPKKSNSIKVFAARLRSKIDQSLELYDFKPNELGIIKSLVLGQRQNLSKELLTSYANAGAIHILAVSGLHIGILFFILSFILKPLEYFSSGKLLKTGIIILFLWGFAFLTGLSASVVRAVTMFTFIAIGMSVNNRKSSVLHALVTSFFILVLIQPLFIFDVGFQMSYAAVLGIVLFYPEFAAIIPRSRWYFPRKIVQLLLVSFTATLGTLPISLFYFHQFPGLFFLSNIIIVPFVGVIMGIGIVVVLLALFAHIPDSFVFAYATVLSWMNSFIQWIAQQESFLFQNISFSLLALVISYVLISFFYGWLIDKKWKKFSFFLLSILILQFLFIINKKQKLSQKETIIFHKNKETIIGIVKGNILILNTVSDSIAVFSKQFIVDYCREKNIKKVLFNHTIPNIINVENTRGLIVDSIGVYKALTFQPDWVLLRQSPKINLERLIQETQAKLIIADGSNYKYKINEWRKTCVKNKVVFHATRTQGAFVLK